MVELLKLAAEPDRDLRTEYERQIAYDIMSVGGRWQQPFGTYIGTTASSTSVAYLAKYMERVVFGEAFGTPAEQHDREYSAYESASLFVVVIDHKRARAAGSARIVLPSSIGLKTLSDIESFWETPVESLAQPGGFQTDVDNTWDVATLSVAAPYRKGLVSQALHQAICTAAFHAHVRWLISILDKYVYRLLQMQLRRMFNSFINLGLQMYAGSPSLPVWCDLETYTARLRRESQALFETLFLGRHLEEAVSTPDWNQLQTVIRSERSESDLVL